MATDKNKSINSAILYNHLNLARLITKSTGENVKYIHDAFGLKLRQEVYSASNVLQKATDYVGEFVYENDVLQFVNHEEGRIIPTGNEYQYHLKDHLGDVRVTFTAAAQTTTTVTAGLESANQSTEGGNFLNYPSSSQINPVATNAHSGTNSMYLNGGYNGQIGLAKSFSVMPGDMVQIQAYAKYGTPSGTPGDFSNFVLSLLAAFNLSAPAPSEVGTAAAGVNYFGGWEFGTSGNRSRGDAMKVFATIFIFDRNYNLIDAAYQASTSSNALMSASYTVNEPGYAYLYISNEHPYRTDVYFDDVSITHTPSPIVSSSDYFAFGYQFGSGERTGNIGQPYLYNGKELQDELNLGWLDYGARMYMSDIGRWGVQDELAEKYFDLSLYNYALNSPVSSIDPDGNEVRITNEGTLFTGDDAKAAFSALQSAVQNHFDDREEGGKITQTITSFRWNFTVQRNRKESVGGMYMCKATISFNITSRILYLSYKTGHYSFYKGYYSLSYSSKYAVDQHKGVYFYNLVRESHHVPEREVINPNLNRALRYDEKGNPYILFPGGPKKMSAYIDVDGILDPRLDGENPLLGKSGFINLVMPDIRINYQDILELQKQWMANDYRTTLQM